MVKLKIYQVILKEDEIKLDFSNEVKLLMEHMDRKYAKKFSDTFKNMVKSRKDIFKYSTKYLEKYCIEEKTDLVIFQKDNSSVDFENPPPEISDKIEKLRKNLIVCSIDLLFITQNISKRTFICEQLIKIPLKTQEQLKT